MAEPLRKPQRKTPPEAPEDTPSPQPAEASQDVQASASMRLLKLDPGDTLQVSRPGYTTYNFHGRSFFQMSLQLTDELARLKLTRTEYIVLNAVIGAQKRNSAGIIGRSQAAISKRVNVAAADVSRAVKKFVSWNLIIREGYRKLRLNPHAAFYGTSEEQAGALAEMQGYPQIRLPPLPEVD